MSPDVCGAEAVGTLDALARLLALTPEELRDLAGRADALYTARRRRKASGGERLLHVPSPELRTLQRRLLSRLLCQWPVSGCAFGYVRGRSAAQAASRHVGQQCVVRLDIRDFFPSVTKTMVERALALDGLIGDVASVIAQLVTHQGRLPQGAPTSPTISNIVFRRADQRLASLVRRRGLRYTRYADDLTFSGADTAPAVIPAVRTVLQESGFRLREEKTRIQRRGGAQRVLGLVVNDCVGVPRQSRRALRAALHRAEHSPESLTPARLARLEGAVAHIGGCAPHQAAALREALSRVKRASEHP